MSLFAPHPTDIGDADVPAYCPSCGRKFTLCNLNREQKSFLLETTSFQDFLQEHAFLVKVREIVDDYPDTMHPLIRSKIGKEDSSREMLEMILHLIEPGSQFDSAEVRECLADKRKSIAAHKPHDSDELVDARINEMPGLRDELTNNIFDLFDRLKFVEDQLSECDFKVIFVGCSCSESQFLVLEETYYRSLS